MTQTEETTTARAARRWLASPEQGHAVQFYCSDDALLEPLTRFVGAGLSRGDSCIVIATLPHLQALDLRLQSRGLDTVAVQLDGRLQVLDAEATLAQYVHDGKPDLDKLNDLVSPILREAIRRNRPVRIYGEMVALLWKDGNKRAVRTLEELWDGWAKRLNLILYCAYPQLHFILNDRERAAIRAQHDRVL